MSSAKQKTKPIPKQAKPVMKEIKPNAKEKEEKALDIANKIDETDEMKLKMLAALDRPDSEDILFPPELNAYLIEQLKVMTCENNQLRKCIFNKDQEIKELNKTVADLNQRIRDIISGSGPAISSKSAGVISAKITELCKQNRHLIAEAEGYKTKNAALERKIMNLELINKEHENIDVCICKEEPVDAKSDELKELNHKLVVLNKKLYESKNKNFELKNEILMATKILQQELGEKFTSIKELQNDLAGWKGRAQIITILQAKVSELEEKLNGKHKDLIDAKKKDQSQIVRELEMKKKMEIDQALKDSKAYKLENQELKKKLDGLKCRVKNLECDATVIRQKMQTFVDKSNHDDMLINEQRNQIKTTELYYQEILKENAKKMTKMENEISEYQNVVKTTDAKIDAIKSQTTEKAAKIEELKAQLQRYEECSLQSVFFTPMKNATDNEIKKLTDLIQTLNSRLDSERNKWHELDATYRKINESRRKLQRKVNALEAELRIVRMPKRTMSRTSTSSLEIGTGTKKSYIPSFTAEPSIVLTPDEDEIKDYDNLEKDDLKYKLQLADERLKILEDKLKMLEEEKREDYDHLIEMIQTSKQLFNEALSVLQKVKCVCG